MQFQGYSVDNLHRGDVRITGDLEVDGDMEIKGDVVYTGDVKIEPPNCLSTDCINSATPATGIEINTEYKLPIVKGTANQVLTQVDALGNCEFKNAGGGTGTARVITNKYYMVTPQPNTAWSYNTYQTIDSVGNGSKVIQADDFPTFAQIRIKAFGTWNITSTTPQVSPKGVLRLTFGTIQIELDDILIATLYTGSQNLNYVGGFNWNIYITRFSATLIKIAFTNQTGTTIGPYYYVAPEHLSQSFDQYSLPSFPANIELEWKNTSALTTDPEIYPITGGYSIDIMNPTTDILTSTSSPATDHLTLANLNAGPLGDGGHVNAFLINGIKPMTGDLKMNNNNIIDANEITKTTPSGANLEIKNNDGPVVISAQGLLSNIQLTTPNNMILTGSNMEFFTGTIDCYGNINMQGNNISNIGDLLDNTSNNKIDMKDPVFLNAINISSNGNGCIIQETTSTNNIGILPTGGGMAVASGNLQLRCADPVASLNIVKQFGGNINLDSAGLVVVNNSDLDMNNNDIVNCININELTAVGGKYSQIDTVVVDGTDSRTSLVNTGSSVGSNIFDIDELKDGAVYHVLVKGDIETDSKEDLQVRILLGAVVIFDTTLTQLADTGATEYAFE